MMAKELPSKKALLVSRMGNFFGKFELNNVALLQSLGYEVYCAANFDVDDHKLDDTGAHKVEFKFVRSPLAKQNISECKRLSRYMKEEGFDLVHCHMPVGGVYGRIAAHKAGIHPVLYTAHGFHFLSHGPIQNWIYYPVEKFLSRYTDILFTINQEDYKRAQKFHMGKLVYLPGVGVNTEKIAAAEGKREELCLEVGIPEDSTIWLSVGDINKNKNHISVIRFLEKHREDPRYQKVKYLICGFGPDEEKLKSYIKEHDLDRIVYYLGRRTDIYQILKSIDVFFMPSIREGLSLALMEAMAAGLPVVCGSIRGNVELIDDLQGGYLYDVHTKDGLAQAIEKLMAGRDDWDKLGAYNQEKIKKFDSSVVKEKMLSIYKSL